MKNGAPLLFYGDSYRFPDIYHTIRFLAPDPQIVLEHDGEIVMLTNSLEQGRAQKQSRATKIHNIDEFGSRELVAGGMKPALATATVIERFLGSRGLTEVTVPPSFPLGLADALRAKGLTITVAEGLERRRRTKRADEIAALEATQRATEEAWQLGVDAIARMSGSGPILSNQAVVMDIFPQHKETRYFADMTRTVSKGAPPAEITKMYEIVKQAQDAGIKALRPGVTGREVHELVEDIIFAAGYDTLRTGQKHNVNDPVTRGFIHGTGHGVGLEIHEAPGVGRAGTSPLAVGDVVTVEPGIYDPDVGGVRLEDMLVITADGSRNLTRAPRQLVI